MEEFVVGVQLDVGCVVWLVVKTSAVVVGCQGCGARAMGQKAKGRAGAGHAGGQSPVVLVWRKRLWRCLDRDCDVGTWSEETDACPSSGADRPRSRLPTFTLSPAPAAALLASRVTLAVPHQCEAATLKMTFKQRVTIRRKTPLLPEWMSMTQSRR